MLDLVPLTGRLIDKQLVGSDSDSAVQLASTVAQTVEHNLGLEIGPVADHVKYTFLRHCVVDA